MPLAEAFTGPSQQLRPKQVYCRSPKLHGNCTPDLPSQDGIEAVTYIHIGIHCLMVGLTIMRRIDRSLGVDKKLAVALEKTQNSDITCPEEEVVLRSLEPAFHTITAAV